MTTLEDVWRRETPHVLAALVRRYGRFDAAEDAVQEALIAASREWPRTGLPEYPRGWLIRVAARRLVDETRSDHSRKVREDAVDAQESVNPLPSGADDSIALLLLCAHPSLTPASAVALTLRAVGGLSTAQIAAAFLLPTATMAQRISRAKATLRRSGACFRTPDPAELPARVSAALHVVYLMFNEGYATSRGDGLLDVSLTREAIRLGRELRSRLPSHDEAAGLLALMLLTESRAATRVDPSGELVTLEHQDRTRWDRNLIAEGVAIVEQVLPRGPVGAYQLQAAVAAVHAEARTWAATDWPQIAALYRMLELVAPSLTVRVNLAVAVGMADGPAAGLSLVDAVLDEAAPHHRLHAVRAHLLERLGRVDDADAEYATAASLTTSVPEQRYLNARRARISR